MNKVQTGLRLPLTGLATPRLLMCSASMGAEGSVTLQLREAVQAPVINESTTTINNVTIGYPDPDVLADVIGTFQAATRGDGTFDVIDDIGRPQTLTNTFFKAANIGTSTTTINKTETVAKVIETAATQKTSTTSTASIVISAQQPLTMTSIATSITPSSNSNLTAAVSLAPVKKQRPKTSSPTRHGPQQCQVCSKVFGNASALAKHKLTHSDERKYVCGMCSKAFKRQDHLNGHMLTHRNKKPYECKAEGCGKSYCDARSLRRHMENHHSSLVMTTVTAASAAAQNQSNSMSSNHNIGTSSTAIVASTITNPSLSPATASGDASSPHGATCIYQINGDGNTITAINSKSPSPSSPNGTTTLTATTTNNEGLTRQQLDLISQIMQQTKQANGQRSNTTTTVQRPRTWNMQTQLQQSLSKSSSSVDNIKNSHVTTTIIHHPNNNDPKLEQKPVECNLCHRKFKNIPALNGHMRLHGGYFKKETDIKKPEKKESNGPPLQTASVGVRALIEEKIINKRSKDLKGSFIVPAAPLSATRRLAEAEALLNAKNVSTISNTNNNTITIVASGITSNTLNGLTKQTVVQQVSQQTSSPTAASVVTVTAPLTSSSLSPSTTQKTTSQISTLSTEKDATLIELLKRGTKVAVKRACSDSGQHTTRLVVAASSISSPETSSVDSSPSLVLSNGSASPLSLTISQAPSTSGSSDIYTLAYSSDNSAPFLSDNDMYSVNDTAMLLQAVDSIHLLQDSSTSEQLDDIGSLSDYTSLSDSVSLNQSFTPSRQMQAVLDSPLPDSLVEFGTLNSKDYMLYGSNDESPTTSASPLPSPYPTPPASHETIAQASPFLDDSHHFSDASTFFHDDKKTKNFLLDDNSEFFTTATTTTNSMTTKSIKDNSNMSESERILQLKNELFNESKTVLDDPSNIFRNVNKSILDDHDLFKGDNSFLNNDSKTFIGDNSAKLQDFNQNLDFLDEAQAFSIDDDRNASSPLSAAFFSTAEEVKEALDEILPNEDDEANSALDLYFLSGLHSHMMSTSDDPLLSSIPRDFGGSCNNINNVNNCIQNNNNNNNNNNNHNNNNMNNNNNNMKLVTNQIINGHPIKHETPNFDIDPFSPPEAKKIKTEFDPSDNSDKSVLSVQTEQILTRDNIGSVFLSPNSISSMSGGSPKLQCVLMSSKKMLSSTRTHEVAKKQEQFKSNMKKKSQLHFSPSPMLNPQRHGQGLFTATLLDKLLDIDDEEESIIDFFEKSQPRINIGSDYQATLPSDNSSLKSEDRKSCETLLWKPSVLEDERQLDRFIELAKSSAVTMGLHSIESALRVLMESQGEVHVAVMKLLQNPDNSGLEKRWSQLEMEQFLKGLEKYGKDFSSISRNILNKTTGDCVQLYYFWKKLCNEYKTTHLPAANRIDNECNFMNIKTEPNMDDTNNFFDYVNGGLDEHNLNNNNSTIQNGNNNNAQNNPSSVAASNHHNNNNFNNNNNNNNSELRPHVCEVPDCSASFSSRVALHGHTRIHCIGRNMNQLNNGNLLNNSSQTGANLKDDFPCRVCGKVFNKVKSRSAHMKSHRPQESEHQQCSS